MYYYPFTENQQLRDAYFNNPALGPGSSGTGVAMIQGALLDLKFALPVSTRKTGAPDGMAREFDMRGSFTRRLEWSEGDKFELKPFVHASR